ncbi:MAG: hypothetical protein FWE05_02225 [Defluviitaleaceae bacterium]|nr:hypothetical protein [Defluviitaleaceae bacterium]
MKFKSVLATTAMLVLAVGVMPACTTEATTVNATPQPLAVTQSAPASTTFNMTVLSSPDNDDEWATELPANAMSMEAGAQAGAQYIYDVLGISMDGMYVSMRSSFRSDRYGETRIYTWEGMVALTRAGTGIDGWEYVDSPIHFTVNAVTGERIQLFYTPPTELPWADNDEAYRFNAESRAFFASEQGVAILALDNNERANLVGLTQERIEEAMQEARAIAEAHFNISTLVDIVLEYERGVTVLFDEPREIDGVMVIGDTVPTQFPGVIIGLDPTELLSHGNHTFILTDFIFTATNATGHQIEIWLSESGSVILHPVF